MLHGTAPAAPPEYALGELRLALAMYRSAETRRWEKVWEPDVRLLAAAHVLVTGGTSGIGHAIAHAFHAAGADVTITGTRADADDVRRRPRAVHVPPVPHDRARRDRGRRRELDRLDVLVNNAGQNLPGGRSEYEPDVFEEAVAVNLFGAFRMATACRDAAGARARSTAARAW